PLLSEARDDVERRVELHQRLEEIERDVLVVLRVGEDGVEGADVRRQGADECAAVLRLGIVDGSRGGRRRAALPAAGETKQEQEGNGRAEPTHAAIIGSSAATAA